MQEKYLVSKTEANAKENTAEYQNVNVEGGGLKSGADHVGEAADDDGGFAAIATRDVCSKERRDEASYVEGGCESCEELAVKFAVVAHFCVFSHLPVYTWKEFLQEWLH